MVSSSYGWEGEVGTHKLKRIKVPVITTIKKGMDSLRKFLFSPSSTLKYKQQDKTDNT